jgi:hypothetical protein
LIQVYGPSAADRSQRRHGSKGQCHSPQHRQAVAQEWLLSTSKYERQYRQDARTDDRQRATQKH